MRASPYCKPLYLSDAVKQVLVEAMQSPCHTTLRLPLEAEVLGLILSRPSDTPHYEPSRPRILPTSTLNAVGPFLDELLHSQVFPGLRFYFLETFSVWTVKSTKLDTRCIRTEAADCVAQYKEQHCCCPSEVWCAASAAQSHREPASKRGSVTSERYICCSFYLFVYDLFNL